MAKRFLIAFGWVLLYMALWAGVLYGIILLTQDNEGLLLLLIAVATVLILLGFVPLLDLVAKRAFAFPGQGQPVPASALREQLLAVNGWVDAPVMVTQRKRRRAGVERLVITWKYVDARWWELLAKAGLTQLYELHVRLDEARHCATLIDVTKAVQWRAGPTEVRLRGGFFRGILFAYEVGEQWDIDEDWELGLEYDYDFDPAEIKLPVLNTILRSGWDVRFGLW